MKQINLGIIGTGWCGGIRAEAARASALVKNGEFNYEVQL